VRKILIIALSTLGLLLAAPSTAVPRGLNAPLVASYGNMSWFLIGFELGPWEEYLIHELTPDLEQLDRSSAPQISWLALEDSVLLPDFASSLILRGDGAPNLHLIRQHVVSDLLAAAGRDWGGLERSVVMPGLSAPFSDGSALTVSAVLATQSFAAPGMNFSDASGLDLDAPLGYWDWRQAESSRGAGLRFALSSELAERMTVQASFQSRIGMSEFASVRGVHGSRAELDIPSRVQLGMQWQAGQTSALQLGLAQIFYSEVGAFPSRALPARFNALLGDSTSPLFGWEDLLVASVGWRWQPTDGLQLHVDYQTRAQPEPSSPLLANVLAPELAKNAVTFGLNKTLSPRSRFLFNAAYAPPEFAFGGNVLGVVSDRLDQTVELEAVWSLEF
jgi:long-chain fatty acid transport protein